VGRKMRTETLSPPTTIRQKRCCEEKEGEEEMTMMIKDQGQ
jgi:hypothetical protein